MLDEQALESLATNFALLATNIRAALDKGVKKVDLPTGVGSLLQISATGALQGMTILDDSYFCRTSSLEDMAIYLGTQTNFQDVFFNWRRVALGAARAVVASEAEAGGFSYSYGKERVTGSTATVNTAGFVEPKDRTGDYTFEVELSADAGTGGVGLVLGYVKDTLDTVHTLTLMRHHGGLPADRFGLYLDIGTNAALPAPLASSNSGLTGVDWNAGLVKVRVIKVGNILTCETNNGGATGYVAGAKLTFDLSSNPNTSGFATKWRHGFVTLAQTKASWNVLLRTSWTATRVLDFSLNVVLKWNAGTWMPDAGKTPADYVQPNHLYYSRANKKFLFVKLDGSAIFLD